MGEERRVEARGWAMTTFFTSDEHYGHANIIRHCNRPFRDVGHMTEALILRHNATVKPADTVWHLGDFCWKEKLVAPVLRRLNGTHYLVVGNHDPCHPMHRKSEEARQRYLEYGFARVETRLYTQGFLLHHMPYTSDDRHDEKYAEWRPAYEGAPLLHGHVHQSWRTRPELQMINVGVDVWGYCPVSLETLRSVRLSP